MYRKYEPMAVLLEPAHHEPDAVGLLVVEATVDHGGEGLVDLEADITADTDHIFYKPEM